MCWFLQEYSVIFDWNCVWQIRQNRVIECCLYPIICVKGENLVEWEALPATKKQQSLVFLCFCLFSVQRSQPLLASTSTFIKVQAPSATVHIHLLCFPMTGELLHTGGSYFFLYLSLSFFVIFQVTGGRHRIKTHTFLHLSQSANTCLCVQSKLTCVLPKAYF